MECKIQTKAIKVMVTTEDYEIQGYIHIKPGGYQSRISDLLNAKDLRYIAITDAVYLSHKHPEDTPSHVDTMLVRLDTIKVVIPMSRMGEGPEGVDHTYKDTPEPSDKVTPKGWG